MAGWLALSAHALFARRVDRTTALYVVSFATEVPGARPAEAGFFKALDRCFVPPHLPPEGAQGLVGRIFGPRSRPFWYQAPCPPDRISLPIPPGEFTTVFIESPKPPVWDGGLVRPPPGPGISSQRVEHTKTIELAPNLAPVKSANLYVMIFSEPVTMLA